VTPRELDSPATLVWAVRLLYAEAAGLVVLAAYLLVLDFTADTDSIAVAVALTGFTVLAAVAVVLVARALARRSSHARGPAIVVQLFLIASGGFVLQNGTAWIGALLMALGVGVGLLCVLPPTTRALGLD
jgi:hypothetical protein